MNVQLLTKKKEKRLKRTHHDVTRKLINHRARVPSLPGLAGVKRFHWSIRSSKVGFRGLNFNVDLGHLQPCPLTPLHQSHLAWPDCVGLQVDSGGCVEDDGAAPLRRRRTNGLPSSSRRIILRTIGTDGARLDRGGRVGWVSALALWRWPVLQLFDKGGFHIPRMTNIPCSVWELRVSLEAALPGSVVISYQAAPWIPCPKVVPGEYISTPNPVASSPSSIQSFNHSSVHSTSSNISCLFHFHLSINKRASSSHTPSLQQLHRTPTTLPNPQCTT